MDDQFGKDNGARGGDWQQPQEEQVSAPATYNPTTGAAQLSEGIGGFDESSALFPRFKDEIKWFWGVLKGPLLKGIALVWAVRLLVFIGVELLGIVLHIAGVGPTLFSLLGGLQGLVSFVCGVANLVLGIAFFRIAHDMRTGFLQQKPDSVRGAIDYVKPVFIPVLIATLVSLVAIMLGSALCLVPGVLAFVALFPVRYIAATHPDQDFSKNMESSIDLGKRYWGALLVLAAMMIAVAIVPLLLNFTINSIAGLINVAAVTNFGSVASALVVGISNSFAAIASTVLSLLMFAALWCLEGGVVSTLVRARKGD